MCGDCIIENEVGQAKAPAKAEFLQPKKIYGNFLLDDTCPRTRLIGALVFAFLVASLSSIEGSTLALIFSILITMTSAKPLLGLLKRLLVVNTFIIFMWFMLPFSFSTPGEVIGVLGPLEVTKEGVLLATLLTLKANAILLTVIALLCQGPVHIVAEASRSLGAPNKLVNLFLLCTRYFQVIFGEYQRLRLAMKARGFKSNFTRHSLKSLGSLLGILLVRSFDRADRIHKAMLARGYSGELYVKSEFSFRRVDAILAATIVLIGVALVVAEWHKTIS